MGAVPGRILLSVNMGSSSPVDRDEIQETNPKWWNINLYCSRLFNCFVDSCNFATKGILSTAEVEKHKTKNMPFWPLCWDE